MTEEDKEVNTQLFEFISEFKELLLEFKRLKVLIIGSKDIDSESDGLRDRLVKLEKRVAKELKCEFAPLNTNDMQKHILKLINSEVNRILEIKRKEILASVWKVSGIMGSIITFLITVIIPFINTVTHPTKP